MTVLLNFKKDFHDFVIDPKNMIFINVITGDLYTIDQKIEIYKRLKEITDNQDPDYFDPDKLTIVDDPDNLLESILNIISNDTGILLQNSEYEIGEELSHSERDIAANLVNYVIRPIDNFLYLMEEKGIRHIKSKDGTEYVCYYGFPDQYGIDIGFSNITYDSFEVKRCV